MFRNSKQNYGLTAIITHWLSAIVVIGLFAVGVWMVELTYYSPWYKNAPHLHKSIGVLLLALTVFRLIWRWSNTKPEADSSHILLEKHAAKITHSIIYLLLLTIMLSGLMISMAEGRGIMVFDWFEVPGISPFMANQADVAGSIHQLAAYGLMGLVLLHGLGALKHHFIDKDATLVKMLKFNRG
ncbi:cytochrome b [Shewanella acanthi]|uniref:cytochrome b n=1 Tax=Shewanella acanthi TaxID=2864212 RepID=UPI001C65DBBB|nr:cytochrome b [Shewanella acanthi]QYJ79787.1 cytochrome b [Shewanella acanthi]